ncbi:hypothetical protein LEP1GSC047_2449 [Leptospira inadai serovar Lyme str. 10]|uniref:Uncharacterized protein n=1 Tax=Leptospira inadai serovar Lyme str. 10 TaxID=1049790 RepID=V6HEH8_9LEPT|nr:hypothetical protein LEP1GSC047_2449 [Leptospira inadai serovar Lyme str. 10]
MRNGKSLIRKFVPIRVRLKIPIGTGKRLRFPGENVRKRLLGIGLRFNKRSLWR